jgi:hypothetical protein
MQQSPWKAHSRSASQAVSRLLWSTKVRDQCRSKRNSPKSFSYMLRLAYFLWAISDMEMHCATCPACVHFIHFLRSGGTSFLHKTLSVGQGTDSYRNHVQVSGNNGKTADLCCSQRLVIGCARFLFSYYSFTHKKWSRLTAYCVL